MYKETIIRPRYAETDQMGVVYHGNYFTYFEVGRSDFFRQNGYTYKHLEESGIIMPVIESGCKYFKPALYDEEVIIRTTLVWNGRIKTTFKYDLYDRATETLLASGFTQHAFVGRDLKPVKLKALEASFIGLLETYRGDES